MKKEDKISNKINTIGIFTIQCAKNYGAFLQAYALRQKCLNYVENVSIINYSNKEVEKEYKLIKINSNNKIGRIKDFVKSVLVLKLNLLKKKKFDEFSKRYFNLSQKVDDENLSKIYDNYDKFIVGSDQVWNPDVTKGLKQAYTLENLKDDSKKSSYAASVATNNLSSNDMKRLVDNVKKFKEVSVREETGKKLLEENGIKDIEVVLDPTFLLEKDEWDKLTGDRIIKEKYIFVYVLEANEMINKIINDLAEKENLKIVSFDILKKYKNSYGNYYSSGPIEFLNFIKYSEYTITNSFHATVFSIIFEKLFLTIPHSSRGSRMIDLLNKLQINDRVILNFEDYIENWNKKIDYNNVKKILKREKDFSIKYLEKVLNPTIYGNKKKCCGCTACMTICPVSAITMVTDEKGFKYPVVNEEKCINCGLCKKVCPIKDEHINIFNENIKFLALKNKDAEIRNKSSSGGAFYLLANEIIKNFGIVYGVAYDKNFNAKHIRIDKKENLSQIMGSKYMQSNLDDILKEVINDLKNNKTVLFSGTPCQISGLKSLVELKKVNDSKLYLCDIVCHSTPSPLAFNSYLIFLEKKYNSKVTSVNFRNKSNDLINNMEVKFENEFVLVEDSDRNMFYRLFFDEYLNRNSCYACKFKKIDRISDITIGDYWGVERLSKRFDDKKGVSLVLINSLKGEDLFNRIKNNAEIMESNFDLASQPPLYKQVYKPNNINNFWKDFLETGIEYSYNKYINNFVKKIKKSIRKILGK